jgi:hypothetical protein
MKTRFVLGSLALLFVSLAPAAFAQSAPSCDGAYNVMRVSELKPGTSADKFMAAVNAHQAWYKSHGYPDLIFAARVVVRDDKTKTETYSDTQFVTYHYSKESVPMAKHDAAWDAYVKMYSETSAIKETIVQCVPTSAVPAAMKSAAPPMAPKNMSGSTH